MRSTKPKAKFSWFKNWLHDWAWLDLTLLPGGIALAYFLKSNLANGFWFNLSTELIGAYISVRFIDYLLKRTENRHRQRRELAGNINWFANRAKDMIPYFDDRDLTDLNTEIDTFDKRWDENEKRIKLVYADEKSAIEEIRKSRKRVVELASKFVTVHKSLRKLEDDIFDKIMETPKWWQNLKKAFREYRSTIIEAYTLIEQPLQEAVSELEKPSELSKEEISMLRKYVELITELINIRQSYEDEVRQHQKMDFDLQFNIYQESG